MSGRSILERTKTIWYAYSQLWAVDAPRTAPKSEARHIFREAIHLATEAQVASLVLDSLVGLADLESQAGEAIKTLELLLCVLGHSASTQEAKDRADRLRAEPESRLTMQQIQAVQARAQAKAFDGLVTELLTPSPGTVGENSGANGSG